MFGHRNNTFSKLCLINIRHTNKIMPNLFHSEQLHFIVFYSCFHLLGMLQILVFCFSVVGSEEAEQKNQVISTNGQNTMSESVSLYKL